MPRKKQENVNFDIRTALFIADSYKRSADRAYSKLNDLTDPKLKKEYSSAIYVIISSFAFALEIYFKSIVYNVNQSNITGHDLAKIWNNLPNDVKDWLNINFADNFNSTGDDWNLHIIFDELPNNQLVEFKIKVPEGTAHGMIKGHRDAFQVGRYAFELPKKFKIKKFFYCLTGINLLTQLARGLAYHVYNERQKLIDSKKGQIGEFQDSISFPTSPEDLNYPDLT